MKIMEQETEFDVVDRRYMPIDEIIARDVVSKAEAQSPGLFNYDTLKDGSALFFDQLDKTKNKPRSERRFKTNDDIIKFFARTSQGET